MTMAMELIRHIAGLYSGKAFKGDFTQVYITGNEIWMAQQVLAEQAEGAQGELWAVHAQGPDDLYAAFNREDAEKHAAELNTLPMPEGISVGAVVIPSPWTPAEHWQYLAVQEREHKDAIEGQRRNLAATLLSQNHELMEARAALAQPSQIRCQCCGYLVTDSEHRSCLRAAQQPSPAPELAVLERWGSSYEAFSPDLVRQDTGRYVKFVDAERIVGALREKIDGAESQAEYQTRRAEHFAKERDAVLSRLAELEKQAPVTAVSEETFSDNGTSDIITRNLPIGTPLYTAPVAQAQHSVPEGWKLVPVEPTKEMMLNGSSCQHHGHDDLTCVQRQARRGIWSKMLAASPQPAKGE